MEKWQLKKIAKKHGHQGSCSSATVGRGENWRDSRKETWGSLFRNILLQRIDALYRATGKQYWNNSVKPWYLCTRNDTRDKGNKNNCWTAWTEKCASISNADVGNAQERKGKAIDRLIVANTKDIERQFSYKIHEYNHSKEMEGCLH